MWGSYFGSLKSSIDSRGEPQIPVSLRFGLIMFWGLNTAPQHSLLIDQLIWTCRATAFYFRKGSSFLTRRVFFKSYTLSSGLQNGLLELIIVSRPANAQLSIIFIILHLFKLDFSRKYNHLLYYRFNTIIQFYSNVVICNSGITTEHRRSRFKQ